MGVKLMEKLFLEIINLSISASYLIIFVLLIRFIFKMIPKRYICILWMIVGLRLIVPFSFESSVSLIPSTQTFSPIMIETLEPQISSGIEIIDKNIVPMIKDSVENYSNENIIFDITHLLMIVWLTGIVILMSYSLISYLRLAYSLHDAVLLRDNIWQSEKVVTPFILGIINPKIYIPYNINDQILDYVEMHEDTHVERNDHITKIIAYFLLTIHWFNPFVWVSYHLLGHDIESACDETTIKDFDVQERKEYASALLRCSVNERTMFSPLAFGEIEIKERITRVIKYKKASFKIILITILICMMSVICFMSKPKEVFLNETQVYAKYGDKLNEKIIETVLINKNAIDYNDENNVACVSYKILALEERNDEIVVYTIVDFGKYSLKGQMFTILDGFMLPAVFTFDTNLKCKEYWLAKEGPLYSSLLKQKFPNSINYDVELYRNVLNYQSFEKANEYFETDIYTSFSLIENYGNETQDALLTKMIDVYILRPDATDNELMKKVLGIDGNVDISINDFRIVSVGWNENSFVKPTNDCEGIKYSRGMIYTIYNENYHWKQKNQIVPFNPWAKKLQDISDIKMYPLNYIETNKGLKFEFRSNIGGGTGKFNPIYSNNVYYFPNVSDEEIIEYVKQIPLSISLNGEGNPHYTSDYCEHSLYINEVSLYIENENGQILKVN